MKENILGTEKIGTLIRKFSIPCIISMLVNSLYNIVDQIFIGWGVGYLGNGATNIIFPLNILVLAFALMIGDGTSAYLSLKLGEKQKDKAAKGVGNGIIVTIIVSLVLSTLMFIFLPLLINLFGCTDALRDYALNYGHIIILGFPFMMIGSVLNGIIRADGNPKYSMISMVSGALLNVILDPIFIFVFHMGVEGAAIATVISQIVTFILNVLYIRKFKTIKLTKETLKLDFSCTKKLLGLGISSFITQLSFVVVMATENNMLAKYGALSEYGSEIPITVIGIVMKLSQILNSIIIGLAVGSQPILGYNYGAKNYDRVKKTLKTTLIVSVIISTCAFILFQTIPDKLIMIFGSGNDLYMEFACMAFRIYLLLVICNGIQIPTTIFFQAIGKSGKSALLSLTRQIIFLVPAVIILGALFGINGILYAGPCADGMAFILAVIFLTFEMKHLGKTNKIEDEHLDDVISSIPRDKHVVVTISREYGSGGRYVGKLVSEKLGIKFFDRYFVTELASKTGLSAEYIEASEQRRNNLETLNNGYFSGNNNQDDMFIIEKELVEKVANENSCVIIGRCSDFILKDNKDVVKVFIYSDMNDKINRACEYYHMDEKDAKKKIISINKQRANHYKYYTDRNWQNPENYDLCINSAVLGVEGAADVICNFIENKTKKDA